jgi:capsid portal protein
VSEVYYVDVRCIRSDKKNQTFYYSEEYAKKWARHNKVLVYPAYIPNAIEVPTSILFIKNNVVNTYGVPIYTSALKDCLIEREIDKLHLNSLFNGMMSSYIINFNNGLPTDEQKAEIERNIQEKFAGADNAGRIMLNFANGKDNGAEVQKLEIDDFGEKYQAASKRSREGIYTVFRVIPQVCGLMSESTGFNTQEFSESFKLVNRTVVRPIQKKISDAFDKLFQTQGAISIEPFSIEYNTEETVR